MNALWLYFQIGERVKRCDELLSYSANKHWVGKRGTIIQFGGSQALIKWDHLDKPVWEIAEHLQLAN